LPVASHLQARTAVVEAGMKEQIRNAPLVGDDPRWPGRAWHQLRRWQTEPPLWFDG
jgi:hypothetical protein